MLVLNSSLKVKNINLLTLTEDMSAELRLLQLKSCPDGNTLMGCYYCCVIIAYIKSRNIHDFSNSSFIHYISVDYLCDLAKRVLFYKKPSVRYSKQL